MRKKSAIEKAGKQKSKLSNRQPREEKLRKSSQKEDKNIEGFWREGPTIERKNNSFCYYCGKEGNERGKKNR